MNKIIIQLIILLPLINAQSRCSNQSSCITYGNVGSSCEYLCNDGCIELSRDEDNNLYCINKTSSYPMYSSIYTINNDNLLNIDYMNYSSLISYINSSDFLIKKTDYRINYEGSGISCPYGCIENNKACVPINTNFICYPEKILQCPSSCNYNKITNSCTTDSPNVVCGTNTKYKVCPYNCYYDNSNDSCYSKNPNYICDLGYNIKCPTWCKLNYDDECISDTYLIPNAICHHIPTPKCPDHCSYDFNKNTCISHDDYTIQQKGYSFCQPYIATYCRYGYDFDISKIPLCSYNMKQIINDICLDDNTRIIIFPLKMIEKYKEIKCKYSDIYCTNYNGRLICNKGSCGYYVRECII